MRLVFMGTPRFALPTLEALLRRGHQVVGVYTQADKPSGRGRSLTAPPVKELAQAHGLPVFQPATLRRPDAVAQLASLHPQAIIVAAYGKLLPSPVLSIPPLGCVNLHPSLLPRHRGPTPIPGAILAGDEVTGVTIMLLNEGMDTGPILAQQSLPVLPEHTTQTLTEKLAEVGATLMAETLERWAQGQVRPQPQDASQATVTSLIQREDGELNFQRPAIELWRRVRAFQPWPGTFTRWQGKLFKIIEARPIGTSATEPGRVQDLSSEQQRRHGLPPEAAAAIETAEGWLGLVRVQLEGKREVSCMEFVNGYREFSGSLLPS